MAEYRIGEVEMKFAQLIWENEPIASGELSKLSEKELSWKKSTTYTVLKRLCEKGIFQNEKGIVTSLISKEELNSRQSEQFVEENFKGSLPAFIAAFTKRKEISQKDMNEIRKMLDSLRRCNYEAF